MRQGLLASLSTTRIDKENSMKVYVVLFRFFFSHEIGIDSIWVEKESADLRSGEFKEAWVEEHDLEDLP